MTLSRRDFLSAVAATAAAQALVVPASAVCVIPESRAGFEQSLRFDDHIAVFPGTAGWDGSIADRLQRGALVIFESAAGFAGSGALAAQREGLSALGLKIDPPIALWKDDTRPPYVDFEWPARARIRDFSSAVPARGGKTIARIGHLPVAAAQRIGQGLFVFLGSPIGPALWAGDDHAHAWLGNLVKSHAAR